MKRLAAQLREARESLVQWHDGNGVNHLKQALIKYIELDDADNESLFLVIAGLLGLSSLERKRLLKARERKMGGHSLWGQFGF